MLTRPRLLLHLEGGVVLILSVVLYSQIHAGWVLFGVLFLAPDLFMLGYLFSVRAGVLGYNLIHTYVTPALLVAVGFAAAKPQIYPFALIITAHIGFDRLLGFGLKYPTHFKDTHLQHV